MEPDAPLDVIAIALRDTVDQRQVLLVNLALLELERQPAMSQLVFDDDEQARRKPAPGANSLIGIVYHLGLVEHSWFQSAFAGEPRMPAPEWAEAGDDDWDFHPERG